MQCQKQGVTKLLLRKIPFFKDIVIMSFECPHCNFNNREVQSVNPLEPTGVKFTLKINNVEDMQRFVVAGIDSAFYIPEIDFEVPKIPKGAVSTGAGILCLFAEDLEMDQAERLEKTPEAHAQIQKIIDSLRKMAAADPSVVPFHIILKDITGNSHISNPFAPNHDVNLKEERIVRTVEQMNSLGFYADEKSLPDKESVENLHKEKLALDSSVGKKLNYKYTENDVHKIVERMKSVGLKKMDAHKLDYSSPICQDDVNERITELPVDCFSCGKEGFMRTLTCEIPFFKEICLMSFSCDHCAYKNTEVKTIGNVSEKARRITFRALTRDDLDRDIFKSDSTTIKILELDFQMEAGTLGSFYTTVEGLLVVIWENLKGNNPFVGDSTETDQLSRFDEFLKKLESASKGELLPLTITIDDPLANCFLLNPSYPDEDPNVFVEDYERTAEQMEDLGLDNMKVD